LECAQKHIRRLQKYECAPEQWFTVSYSQPSPFWQFFKVLDGKSVPFNRVYDKEYGDPLVIAEAKSEEMEKSESSTSSLICTDT